MTIASEEQALCTSCGLCCDGSLFEFTPIKIEERAVFEFAEIGFLTSADNGVAITQPCHHLQNKCCDIYQTGRPAICGRYKCKLLKNFLRDEITFPAALDLIETTLRQRDQIRSRLEEAVGVTGLSLSELFKAWTELQTEETSKSMPVSQLSLDYSALKFQIARNFKK